MIIETRNGNTIMIEDSIDQNNQSITISVNGEQVAKVEDNIEEVKAGILVLAWSK